MNYINKTIKFQLLREQKTTYGIVKDVTDTSYLIESNDRVSVYDKENVIILDILLDGKNTSTDNLILG